MPALRSFAAFVLVLAGAVDAADPAARDVEVTIVCLPEADWQARFEGQSAEIPALWLRLNADAEAGRVERPANFLFRLADHEPLAQRKGGEAEFVEGWFSDGYPHSLLKPIGKTRRFVGTEVELTRLDAAPGSSWRVSLRVEHHLSPPVMQRINYGNAATGAERDRLSVEYPRFEKIEWQGRLFVSGQWRLAGNLLHPGVHPTRCLIFIRRS